MKDELKVGLVLLVMNFILAESIALGRVEAATSFGLQQVLTTFNNISVAFAVYAWTRDNNKEGK